jgi:hypothetical protein
LAATRADDSLDGESPQANGAVLAIPRLPFVFAVPLALGKAQGDKAGGVKPY